MTKEDKRGLRALALRMAIRDWRRAEARANESSGQTRLEFSDRLVAENALTKAQAIARSTVPAHVAAAIKLEGFRLAMDTLSQEGPEGLDMTLAILKRDLERSADGEGLDR